jgi:hypothetical protein
VLLRLAEEEETGYELVQLVLIVDDIAQDLLRALSADFLKDNLHSVP